MRWFGKLSSTYDGKLWQPHYSKSRLLRHPPPLFSSSRQEGAEVDKNTLRSRRLLFIRLSSFGLMGSTHTHTPQRKERDRERERATGGKRLVRRVEVAEVDETSSLAHLLWHAYFGTPTSAPLSEVGAKRCSLSPFIRSLKVVKCFTRIQHAITRLNV